MFVRSKRLFLRPFWPEDWQDVLTGIADAGVVRNLARVPWPYTEDDARSFAEKPQSGVLPHFAVTLPAGADAARPIGCVGLHEEDGETGLGYWLARNHWGRGYMTEAARAVLALAKALGHRRIVANHMVDNPASGRVLRKLGFQPTGAVTERFSLGRGGLAVARGYALDLSEALPDGGHDEDMRSLQAA